MKTKPPVIYISKTADRLQRGQHVRIPKTGQTHWTVINPDHRMGVHLRRGNKSVWLSASYTVWLPLTEDPILSVA